MTTTVSLGATGDQRASTAIPTAVENSETEMIDSPVPKTVLCLGETMAQIVPSDGQQLVEAGTFWIGHAGAESNVAISLARLGTKASWAGILGADPLSERVRRELNEFGVDTSQARSVTGGRTGVFIKDPAEGGSDVYYYRAGSAAAGMDSEFAKEVVASMPGWLHLSGVTCALSLSCGEAVLTALHTAQKLGIPTSFDVNYRKALWAGAAEAGREILAAAKLAAVVFVGLDEAEALWGCRSAQAVHELLEGVSVLVVKDGANECTAFENGRSTVVPALSVNVVEPIGAGDAFAAGWLHGHLNGLDTPACLRLGHLMAGIALTSHSDFGVIDGDPQTLVDRAVRDTNWLGITPHIHEHLSH